MNIETVPFPDPAGGVVDALVALPPAAVFEEVLDGRHGKHEKHRHHRYLLPERVDLRYPVAQREHCRVGTCVTCVLTRVSTVRLTGHILLTGQEPVMTGHMIRLIKLDEGLSVSLATSLAEF